MQPKHPSMSADTFAFWHQWYHRYRQRELTLADLHFVGSKLYGDLHACGIYGCCPDRAYAQGIRVAGRSALEYCVDMQAQEIAQAVQQYVQQHRLAQPIAVIDLFAGTGNLLYHIAHTLHATYGIGLDADPLVARLTTRNLVLIASPWRVTYGSWQDFDLTTIANAIHTVVLIVDPPWGRGYTSQGVDLRMTEPPVPTILTTLMPQLHHQTLWVIKTFERMVPESLTAITKDLHQPQLRTLSSMAPGTNGGYVLGMTNECGQTSTPSELL